MMIGTDRNEEIVTIDDNIRNSEEVSKLSDNPRTFEYNLKDKGAKSKLTKAAKRLEPFTIEENSTSSNLVFSGGAWQYAVLPSLQYWKENKTCKIGDYTVKIGGIKGGIDKSGKHIDTQVVFFADREKVVCHLYNTTCLILVNGHGYRKLIEMFLAPFFSSRIVSCQDQIISCNKIILEKLG